MKWSFDRRAETCAFAWPEFPAVAGVRFKLRSVGTVLRPGRARGPLARPLGFAQFSKYLRRTPAPPMAFLFDSLQAQDRSIQIIQLSTQLNQYFR